MNTSYIYHALGLKDYDCNKTEYKGNEIIHHLRKRSDKICCSHCHSRRVVGNGSKLRRFRSVNIGEKHQTLVVRINRLKCSFCGCDAYEHIPFATGKQRYTHRLAHCVVTLLKKMSIKDVAGYLGLSWDTVKDIHRNYLHHKFARVDLRKVRHIGIDEFAVHRGHEYMTIVVDMDRGVIVHVGQGRGADALRDFWKKVRKQKVRIESVSTDLSAAFISAVMANLPDATYVFDRFHVQGLVGDALERTRRAIWHTDMEVDRRKLIKGTRWLLLRNGPDLYDDERKRLENVLQLNEPLYKAYVLKEYFREVWTQTTKAEAEKVLDDWLEQAAESGVPQLKRLACSIAGFKSGILAYYDCRTSNAKVEGINNKIKVLKRTAYGYRDDEYFKLRLFNLHNDKITRFVG